MSTFGENGGGNTVVAITGHESDAKDVSDSFVDFSIHFVIQTNGDNVFRAQDSLVRDVRDLLHRKYGLEED